MLYSLEKDIQSKRNYFTDSCLNSVLNSSFLINYLANRSPYFGKNKLSPKKITINSSFLNVLIPLTIISDKT